MKQPGFGGRQRCKPEDCRFCDHGIMQLQAGSRTITAPCLNCSAERKLVDLERERDARLALKEVENEKARIRAHNERMARL